MSSTPQLAAFPDEPLRYRFGTFELDTRTGELRRQGVKMRLQEQPFLILKKLLANPGGVVTREDLHATLWRTDTFVDFDTSLNTAIKRLREALGDSADIPVFIETIPRRGYRFIAPVEAFGKATTPSFSGQAAALTASPIVKRSARIPVWAVASVGIAAAALGALVMDLRSPKPIARVVNSTQLTFDGTFKMNLQDGRGNIFYNEREGSHVRLMKIPADGGPPVQLDDSIPGLYLGGVSPDGTKLLVGKPVFSAGLSDELATLKLMDLSSGSLTDLGEIECSDAHWAPGGKILFSRGADVFLADGDGTHSRKLFSVNGHAYDMQFSPDNKRLRLTVRDKEHLTAGIWEANADGSNLHQVLLEQSEDQEVCCGIWSADGRYFFFQTTRNGTSRIWAEREDGWFWSSKPARAVPLTTVPPNFRIASLGSNGQTLLATASLPKAELLRYDASKKSFQTFLNGLPGTDVEASPDGKSFVYVRYPEQTLWRARSDGSGAMQLTGPTMHVALPHWSPDGKRIAFSGMRSGTRFGRPWNLFVVSAEGGTAEQLTHGPISDLDASWSPDGKTIAFGPTRVEDKRQIASIEFLDLATRKLTTLLGSDGICCPRYSPDGRYLIATHSSYDDLLLYDFATAKWTTIVKDLGPLGYMNWTRDGKYVLFDTFEVEVPKFYRIRMADLAIETVTNIGEIPRYYGAFGPWSGIWLDGSPLLVKDSSNEEIYSLELQLP
jgi:Tol biopolymer transport system component/DNA-binding winged helix-turn-helix (wHTH) protein